MSPYHKPLLPVPDAEDMDLHRQNCDTELVTRRLGELVPLLKFVGFQVEQMTAEKTTLSVPLLESAMNQNGTHQAAIFYLIADYTLGIGMFAGLPGCYTIGVHDRCHALPIQFWLKGATVTHLRPGTGAIRAEVTLSPETIAIMRAQMVAKGRCVVKDAVRFYQGDQLIAITEHEMGMYADLPRVADIRASAGQVDRLKTSALMIAGLRTDDLSRTLAGEQGAAIAKRMARASPQLPTLIHARTQHASLQAGMADFQQVLVLGVGLDPKPIEFAREGQTWFLADLPDMLRERAARLRDAAAEIAHSVHVPVDLRLSDWPTKILAAGFNPTHPTLVIFEGVSMYLSAAELRQTLSYVRQLCQNPASRMWLDHVTDQLFEIQTTEVTSFLQSMARLGEPFITGFSDPVVFSGGADWRMAESKTAADVIGLDEQVHHEYRFAMLAPS